MRVLVAVAVMSLCACIGVRSSGSGSSYLVAPGARGSIPSGGDCRHATSSNPAAVKVTAAGFEALSPGTATVACASGKVTMDVREIARVDIDGPGEPVRYHTFLTLRAFDAKGNELELYEAVGISWTIPPGVRPRDFCGHGNTFCDDERVQGVQTDEGGEYRISASYRGHTASFDVTFER